MEHLFNVFSVIISAITPIVLSFIGSGSGTSGDPYIITTVAELEDISSEMDAYYELGNDIDVGAETDNAGGSFWNGGAGWTPIYPGSGNFFSGTLDGKGFTLEGLFINNPGIDAGLFRFVDGGTIKDILFLNPDITTATNNAGVLSGRNRGTACTIEGIKVQGGSIDGGSASAIGGIVGEHEIGTIKDCINDSCSVDGNGSVGGIVGANIDLVRNCIGNAVVTGSSLVGGVVGNGGSGTFISNVHNSEKTASSGSGENSVPFSLSRIQNLSLYNAVTSDGTGTLGVTASGTVDGTASTSILSASSGFTFFTAGEQVRIDDGVNKEIHTIDTVDSDTQITLVGTLANTYSNADIYNVEDGEEYDIVDIVSHDGQKGTAIWFVDDGNATPDLWFEYVEESYISGNVHNIGAAVENAQVAIFTVDDPVLSTLEIAEVVSTDASGNYSMGVTYSGTNHYVATTVYFNETYSGTATSAGSNTLTDSGQVFTASEFDDLQSIITISGGTGVGQTRIISDNTTTQVTVTKNWSTQPDGTSVYGIGELYSAPANFHPTTE